MTTTVTAEPVAAAPAACIDALDAAEKVMRASSDAVKLFDEHLTWDQDVFEALAKGDSSVFGDYTEHLNDIAAQQSEIGDILRTSDYPEHMEKCRALA